MEPQTIEEFEAMLRKDYPVMFSHPGLEPGEIFLGATECSSAMARANAYHSSGLTSVRFTNAGEMIEGSEFIHFPIFANFKQYAALHLEYERKRGAAAQNPATEEQP